MHSSSNYTEAIKFVTGSESVRWPEPDSVNWIEPGKEKESKRVEGDLQAHYASYHTISGISAYTDEALEDPEYKELQSVVEKYKSEHIGKYDPKATANFPFLSEEIDNAVVYESKKALPPCSIPMEVTTTLEEEKLNPLIEGTLYAAAIDESGSGEINLQSTNWWSSLERHAPASDVLELDLGETRVVNWATFEITRKPLFIELDYDRVDLRPTVVNPHSDEYVVTHSPREFVPVTLWTGFYRELEVPTEDVAGIAFDSTRPPWQQVKVFFRDQNQHNITTRYLRLIFKRPAPGELLSEPFVDQTTKLPIPYSIDVRNMRVGRYAGASPNWQSV